ncbi:hypothetical protein FPV67DRAFT_1664125 [Lyophyllum atratum]|nr:hypothetical protein FPV67DRAFT_1664125 [Lyophyllum atratum]
MTPMSNLGTHAGTFENSTGGALSPQSLYYDFFEQDDHDVRASSPDLRDGSSGTPFSAKYSSSKVDEAGDRSWMGSDVVLTAPSYTQEPIASGVTTSTCNAQLEFLHVVPPLRAVIDLTQDETLDKQSGPRKKRRTCSAHVKVITAPSVDLEPRRFTAEVEQKRERDFFHPKWKIKRHKEDEQAGLGSVFRRVEALDVKPFPLDLDEDLVDFTVSREFVSDIYGGNTRATFPSISQKKGARHPYRDFMCLNITYNPYAPQRAGFPGLLYVSRTSDLPKTNRVMIRIKDGVWLYLGQYELVRAAPLTLQEWTASSSQISEEEVKTQSTWSRHICKKKWSRDIRIRIALRKRLGRQPTAEEIEGAAEDGSGVTQEDVRRALNKGEEVINVWVMKCVGYDEAFQRDMKEKSLTWTPRDKSNDRTGKAKKGKRKRQDTATFDVSDEEDDPSEGEIADDGIEDVEDIPGRFG